MAIRADRSENDENSSHQYSGERSFHFGGTTAAIRVHLRCVVACAARQADTGSAIGVSASGAAHSFAHFRHFR